MNTVNPVVNWTERDDWTTCDFCEVRIPYRTRRVVLQQRPSNADEIVAVMYGCGACSESKDLPTANAVIDAIDKTGMWEGKKYLWYTL